MGWEKKTTELFINVQAYMKTIRLNDLTTYTNNVICTAKF